MGSAYDWSDYEDDIARDAWHRGGPGNMTDNDLLARLDKAHHSLNVDESVRKLAGEAEAALRARDTELAAARTFIIDVARTLPTSTEEVYQAFYLFKHRAEVLAGTTEPSVSPPAASAKSET